MRNMKSKNKLVRTSSAVGEANLHLQITPAYRRDIFVDEEVRTLTLVYAKEALNKLGILVLAADCGIDHMHFFLGNWKNHSIQRIAQATKGFSSYMMRKYHKSLIVDKLWGKKFWSEGYFYRTVGQVTASSVKFYVEKSQSKHWKALDYEQYKQEKSNQMQLADFSF